MKSASVPFSSKLSQSITEILFRGQLAESLMPPDGEHHNRCHFTALGFIAASWTPGSRLFSTTWQHGIPGVIQIFFAVQSTCRCRQRFTAIEAFPGSHYRSVLLKAQTPFVAIELSLGLSLSKSSAQGSLLYLGVLPLARAAATMAASNGTRRGAFRCQ